MGRLGSTPGMRISQLTQVSCGLTSFWKALAVAQQCAASGCCLSCRRPSAGHVLTYLLEKVAPPSLSEIRGLRTSLCSKFYERPV